MSLRTSARPPTSAVRTGRTGHKQRVRRRASILLAATAATLLLGAGPAVAHVAVIADSVTPGGYSTLTFRVPNESDTAAISTVEILVPAESAFASVSAREAPGWTADVVTTDLPTPVTVGSVTFVKAVSRISYTATTAAVGPHQFTTFDIRVGPLPDVAAISFAVVQSYGDGTVVRWDQPTPAGGAEPDNPAPVLAITSGAARVDTPSVSATTDGGATAGATTDSTAAADQTIGAATDSLARIMAIIALLAASVAIGIGIERNRRRPSAAVGTGSAANPSNDGTASPTAASSPTDATADEEGPR